METIAEIRTLDPEEFEATWIDKKDFPSLTCSFAGKARV